MDHHHIEVRELDLSASYPDSFTDKINHAVPGLKTSTGELFLPRPFFHL